MLRFTSFHEDVDVVAGFGEVNKVDDIGVFYLLANAHLRLNPLYYVHFELLS